MPCRAFEEILTVKPGTAIVKRALDIGVSLMGLVLLAPMMAITALLIKLDSPGPVFYPSQRMGRNGKPFTMYKFRSMYVNSPALHHPDGSMRVDNNDHRVTRVGRILRLGFDELPQLFNVLKGDMSLIGPRPDPVEALPYYREEDHRRLLVRPGITGLAQIAGRTDIPWQERLKYDIEYMEHQSLWLDCKIAFYTILEFIPPLRRRRFQKEIYPPEANTIAQFNCNSSVETSHWLNPFGMPQPQGEDDDHH
ncbi:MAG TPA: sugar transferase [Chloroflexi bacterium]|nr:MAG: sugar transferase [Chloroflexota bacterium]HDD24048.1 sugar transferase [Chloroflexota bacterium]